MNRESKDRSKKEHSEADAKEFMSNPKSPPAIGHYARMSTGGVGMQSGSQYLQPAQQGYVAAAPGYPGTSAGCQGYQNKGVTSISNTPSNSSNIEQLLLVPLRLQRTKYFRVPRCTRAE